MRNVSGRGKMSLEERDEVIMRNLSTNSVNDGLCHGAI